MQPPARCSNHRCVYIDQCDNSHPGARGRYRHHGLRINTAQDITDITCQFLMSKLILQKYKGLLIKIKVIKGFLDKLKVLKDCNQIKGF